MRALSTAETRDLEAGYRIAKARHLELARTNIRAFASYVIRDEETGKPIDLEPFQEEWHRLADQHRRLMIWAFMESGKTMAHSIIRTLFELGRDPTLRFAIVSGNEAKARKIGSTLAQYIENSHELHEVFPHLKPNARLPWNTEQLTVDRNTISKDPSVQFVGQGSDIQGARLDRVVLDDVLNRDNTRTPHMRKDTEDWYLKTIPGRMTARGRILGIGNAFHPDDLYHRLVKNPEWHGFKFPIVLPDGRSAWPMAWPIWRIEQRKRELGPLESLSQLMCQPIDDALARFKRDHIEMCMARGEGKDLVFALRAVPPGFRVYCGVDLGIKRTEKDALTTFCELLIHPNGDRELLWIEGGRWLASDIMAKMREFYGRFHCIFVVENNAAQDYLVQLMQGSTAIPIVPFTTGKNKADPTFGVEAMSSEFAAGKWIIPNRGKVCHPEVQAWIDDLLGYSPMAHTGDRLMASWMAKEGERLGLAPPPPATGSVHLNLSGW